jgi:hypothetical protein
MELSRFALGYLIFASLSLSFEEKNISLVKFYNDRVLNIGKL